MTNDFFTKLHTLLTTATIIIDRPKGSAHPRYTEMIYPLDYGYLDGTTSSDGDGIDVWVGSIEGEKHIVAALATVDLVKRDVEIKILINCTDDEIEMIMQFHTGDAAACQIIRREGASS